MADAVPILEVCDSAYESLKSTSADDISLDRLLRPFTVDAQRSEALSQKLDLLPESAELLARALRYKKAVIFTEDEKLRDLLLAKKRRALNFEDFLAEYYGRDALVTSYAQSGRLRA